MNEPQEWHYGEMTLDEFRAWQAESDRRAAAMWDAVRKLEDMTPTWHLLRWRRVLRKCHEAQAAVVQHTAHLRARMEAANG